MTKLTNKEFIDRAKSIHGDKYDYSKVEYNGLYSKVEIICPYHGSFFQTPKNHIKLRCNCPKCANELRRNQPHKGDTNSFIKKAKSIHGDKYDYSKVKYIDNKTKVKIICPVHGEFEQIPYSHLFGKGCKKCGFIRTSNSLKSNTATFIRKSLSLHGIKYNYDEVDYISDKEKVCIICTKHGTFYQRPNDHLQGKGCPTCSQNVSNPEMELKSFISSLVECEQSNRTIINPYELDIYIPSRKLAIEFNGNFWHSELNGKDKNYHLNKTKLCNEKGIRLIHIFEDEWLYKQDIVKARLKHILGFSKNKIYARKCKVKEIDSKTKNEFLERYHIQGKDNSSTRLGLFYEDNLVSVMTFGKNRFDKSEGYELIRYATADDVVLIGGAGKLLTYFEKNSSPSKIKTYADIRWSEGNLYKQLGFKHIHNSSPNYFYIKDGIDRHNRIKFQKHKLKEKLEIFDEYLSEFQNMQNNGWDRIWDCGNMVFEKYITLH